MSIPTPPSALSAEAFAPCPFCNANESRSCAASPRTGKVFVHIWCPHCKSQGPEKPTLEQATEAWNRRSRLATPSRMEGVTEDDRRELLRAADIIVNNLEYTPARADCAATLRLLASRLATQSAGDNGWQPIATAPRDGRSIFVGYFDWEGVWRAHEAWWRMPYESAPAKQCWWCYGGDTTLLSADLHSGGPNNKPLGATHWQPLPAPPAVNSPNTTNVSEDV